MLLIILVDAIFFGFISGLSIFLIRIFFHDIILCGLFNFCFFELCHLGTVIKFSITGSLISLIVLFFSFGLIYFIYDKKTLEAIINKKDWTH